MSVFNSLGSNYSKRFVLKSLFLTGNKNDSVQLIQNLARHYNVNSNNVALMYKGRQALEEAIKQANLPPGSKIGINGFTCYVVYQAVEKAGYLPVFIDVAQGSLDYGEQELKNAHKRHDLKAVIVQNTLGLPVSITSIEAFCKEQSIVLIEDLAHSFGAVYDGGREVGTVGSFAMLSFSQDKPLDVVAGGALISKHRAQKQTILPSVSFKQRVINRKYPLFTALIRATYPIGLGRVIHHVLKRLRLLATPMSDNITQPYRLTAISARLLNQKWQNRQSELSHRRAIAEIYKKELPKEMQFGETPGSKPAYLRFPLRANNRADLLAFLKKRGIYIGDTWYDAPIGPARYLKKTKYETGECPRSENLCEHVINLPTHRHVDPQKARLVCATIKQWLALQ